jgi:hypothetical protein
MNHNFLPFEVIELLPKENPYFNEYLISTGKSGKEILANKKHINLLNSIDNQNRMMVGKSQLSLAEFRDAWTLLDSLSYLEEQGYFIQVFILEKNRFTFEILNSKGNDIRYCNPEYDDSIEDEEYKSRIEAYIAGIKHCLNLIKDETNRS